MNDSKTIMFDMICMKLATSDKATQGNHKGVISRTNLYWTLDAPYSDVLHFLDLSIILNVLTQLNY